ncbi:Senescence regulator [Cynara cardunculus var. scolymus]|uniref:Senescence regulator n=1 Tax=Cynara cardunculus var. scolymus TaxID=59895 RepID=A0A103XUD2_CYNCS|nr:Senescence regulator [Cynara cardunculus var. scolymus]
MDEEFDESEVTFAEVEAHGMQENHTEWKDDKLKTKSKKKKKEHSVPINIPKKIPCVKYVESDLFEDDYGNEIIVPPHVILGRRVARQVAYSICSGCGKTSKKRELILVRDLFFRFTGFIEI